jgi:hypothetical protein
MYIAMEFMYIGARLERRGILDGNSKESLAQTFSIGFYED